MPSAIDPTVPPEGQATTSAVRKNFDIARQEIDALQAIAAGVPSPANTMPMHWAGRWHVFGRCRYDALGSTSLSANRVYLWPFRLERPVSINKVGVRVITYAASSIRFGIYNSAFQVHSDLPADLLFAAEPITVGGTGAHSKAVSLQLEAGIIYWAALQASAAVSIQSMAGDLVNPAGGFAQLGLDPVTHMTASLGSPGLPASFGSLGISASPIPAVYYGETFA